MGYPWGASGNGFLKTRHKGKSTFFPGHATLHGMAGTLVAILRMDISKVEDTRALHDAKDVWNSPTSEGPVLCHDKASVW